MIENGQMEKIFVKWGIAKPDCVPLLSSGTPLGMKKLISLFLIILFGILLAFMIMILENFYQKNYDGKKDQTVDENRWRFDWIIAEIYKNNTKKLPLNPNQISILKDALNKMEERH